MAWGTVATWNPRVLTARPPSGQDARGHNYLPPDIGLSSLYDGTMASENNRGPSAVERFVDPRALPFANPRWRGYLPHIYKPGCTYFITFCLDDAVPSHASRRRKLKGCDDPDDIAHSHEPPMFHGCCILKHRNLGRLVEEALLFFLGQRYDLFAWVVMPNHAHAVVAPYEEHPVSKVLHSWKSFTSNQINRKLKRAGRFWEEESFDHLIRSETASPGSSSTWNTTLSPPVSAPNPRTGHSAAPGSEHAKSRAGGGNLWPRASCPQGGWVPVSSRFHTASDPQCLARELLRQQACYPVGHLLISNRYAWSNLYAL